MADSNTKCCTPEACATCKADMCAAWSMAQASLGLPVREAKQDITVSKCSPAKPSWVRDFESVTSPVRKMAPGNLACQSCSESLPLTPALARMKQTTSWPSRSKDFTAACPMVPVAPNTKTLWRVGAFNVGSAVILFGFGTGSHICPMGQAGGD